MTSNTMNDAVTMAGGGGALLAGRYRVVRQLGQGGMGSVWLAEDTQLDGKLFAIKMLPSILVSNKRAYRQLKDEALVAMKLTHPNIVTLRAFEENDGNPFLVMDYVDGETLDDYLAEKGNGELGTGNGRRRGLSEDEVIRLLKPIAAALDYAHGEGVVHRDVKPANVMIRKDGHPYILDFGIAREMQETMTRVTGKLSSGTLLYMSPEQLNGEPPKPAQDVYSFAAMVYECLKGEPPFSRGQIEYQILNNPPPPLAGASGSLASSVMAGLAKKPHERPLSCATVLNLSIPRRTQGHAHVVNQKTCPTRQIRTGWFGGGAMFYVLAVILTFVVSSVLYFKSPVVYEASSQFSIDLRSANVESKSEKALDAGLAPVNKYSEIFNTRIPDWRSDRIITKIVQQYRANHVASTVSDEEIISALSTSTLKLENNSRIVSITVRSKSPPFAVALANAYAQAIESFTDEENKLRCDKAVAQIHSNVERKRREVDKIAKQLLDFRTANKVDNLRSSRETIQQGLSKTTGDILALETEETQLIEWEKMLSAVQKDPSSYGNLSTGVPRAQEIATEFRYYQDAEEKYQKLMFSFTDSHPEVISAKKELDLAKQRFLDAAARALLTGRSTLKVARNRLSSLRQKQQELTDELVSVEQRIVLAESGLGQLEAEFGVANRVLEDLIMHENKTRIEAESNNEIILIGHFASSPSRSIRTGSLMIYGVGIVFLVMLLIFILAIKRII